MSEINNKFALQDKHYEFPYHYVPYFDQESGVGVKTRSLGWGLEYLCYVRHLQELIYSLSPESVLDVGCGEGRLLGLLGPQIRRRVGTDLSERAVRFARAFHPDVEFHAVDATDIVETFDLVVAIEVLEHIPDAQIPHFLNTLIDRTREGGHLILSVPTKVKPVLSKHYRHYDLNLLQEQLASAHTSLTLVQVDYIYKHRLPLHFKLLQAFTQNSWWTFDLYGLRKPMWQYTWQNLRYATAEDGRHLLALLAK